MVTHLGRLTLEEELSMETDATFAAERLARSRAARQDMRGGKRRVKQADKGATDINVMVRKWIKNGTPPVVSGREPRYGDFSAGIDYHTGLTRLVEIQQDFEALPAPVRSFCRNDPGLFLDLVADPENAAKLRELGLTEDRTPAIPKVEIVNPPPAGGGAPDGSEPA